MKVISIADQKRQEIVDTFYWKTGPCCAGCDWWTHINSVCGECTRSAPVPGYDRVAMLGVTFSSIGLAAGHVLTNRGHRCGEFKDSFDWQSLPVTYLRRIGFKGVAA